MMMPNYPRDVRYGDAAMAPLWRAIEASGLPLSFHISEAPDGNGPGELGSYLMVSFQPFRKLWSYLVFSGIFDRHPASARRVRRGWDLVDPLGARPCRPHRTTSSEPTLQPRLLHAPSHYWRTHCWATFMEDPRGLDQLSHIGTDRVLWASDYPHPEGTDDRTARGARPTSANGSGPTAARGDRRRTTACTAV